MKALHADIAKLMESSRVLDGSKLARKVKLMQAAMRNMPSTAPEVVSLHDALLFIAAFPDNKRVHSLAERGLRLLRSHMATLKQSARREYNRLADTGMANTVIEHSYTLDMLRWLVAKFGRDVELVWDDESLGDAFEDLLPLLASHVEYDGLLDSSISTREWMTLARGKQSEAEWLVAQCDRLLEQGIADRAVVDRLMDQVELYVRWQLSKQDASRTSVRFPARPLFAHAPNGRAVASAQSPQEVMAAKLPKPRKATVKEAQQWIDIVRATLASRGRETDPVTYANPREVMIYNLDRGIDVMLIGMKPERRLPIEGFVGYIAAKNRVPIAYGGGWMAFDLCTIGINLFPEFRGGESAHVFAQILRVYRHLFNVRTIRVDPYQFGLDNEEAIRSGAFWFYYRFGFRPVEKPLQQVAEREAARIAADRKYRTSRATLRRLATGRLRLNVSDDEEPAREPIDLGAVSLAVTQWIGKRFNGDRAKAQTWAVQRVAKLLGATKRDRWAESEQRAFESLAPLMALIPDLANWPKRDRDELLKLMRAKGGPREVAFLKAMVRHERLRAAVGEISRSD